MVPRAILMKSGLVSVNTARQVNAAHSKTTVNAARPKSHFSKTAHSIVNRPIHKKTTFKSSNINQRVNIVKDKNVNAARPKAVVNAARPKAVVNAVKGNNVNAVKASAYWVWKPKTKVLDHVSKRNSASITLKKFNYVDAQGISKKIDGGYVAIWRNPRREITMGKKEKSSQDDGSKPSSDDEKKVDEDPRKDSESIDQENDGDVNSTNNVNGATTNEVNVVGRKQAFELP
ncbi:hypothetical protein Tco_0845835 [Tanacetum coccineum]